MDKIEQALRNKIMSEDFSCIGAKASINKFKYQFCVLDKLADPLSTKTLYQALKQFAGARPNMDKRFASFIVCFTEQGQISPDTFDFLLWQQLKLLHEIDEFPWDDRVSQDLTSPSFSFSIAGESYFIVGLCPNHPRKCRNFDYPTLVFNSHQQFNYLKQINIFAKLQQSIRERELNYSGGINPNLIHGAELSEAIQYSGLPAASNWQCPITFTQGKKDDQ